MWVNKVPNVHVWADHTSVKLLLGIRTGALSWTWPSVWQNGTVIREKRLARFAKRDHFCLLSWTDVTVVTCFQESGLGFPLSSWAFDYRLNLILSVKWTKTFTSRSTWNCTFWRPQDRPWVKTPTASPKIAAWPRPFLALRSVHDQCGEQCLWARSHQLPLCQTGAVTPAETTESISTSNLTSVWSRHRNPLALKKLPPSLCLTSNGAFFSSLSFFMFVCKVLYITWIYYAHILPNG